ncbi:MATE family efflux transporter [Sporosarcina gallistercoris]|uniref:MATE family efflux transporter n=1 Tax=Sporosarcina gallistercoris TaxID=2762245 RepID=A0ABR8PJ03_9BACL|nr:MATE family efflux transporter [Sporosarcina gallistercoris]MBD7908145.1 MATE family efflux transporter [Sporosarcina gallistercoris]
MEESIYTRYSVNRLIFIFSLPAILSLIVELMTGIVDTAFAGHLGNASESALTAMGLVSPLLGVFVAIQSLFAISTAIMVSSLLGKEDRIALDSHVQTGFVMTLVLNTAISIVFWFFLEPVLRKMGANGEVLALAMIYMRVILMSNIFSSLGYLLTSVVRAFGHPKTEMFIVSLSVAINLVANAVLTFGFGLGILGIALGTLISEVVCATLAIGWMKRKGYWFTYRAQPMKQIVTITWSLVKIGSVQTVLQSLAGVTAFLVNHQLLTWAGSSQIGSWNIANKVYMLLLMPIIGLTQSVQSILAYFNGSGNTEKQRSTAVKTILLSIGYGVVAAVICFLAGSAIVEVFSTNESLQKEALKMMKMVFITFPFVGITYTMITLLQVTGREGQSLLIAGFRQVLVIIPLVFAMPFLVQWLSIPVAPALAVIMAIPVADTLTLMLAWFLGRRVSRQVIQVGE